MKLTVKITKRWTNHFAAGCILILVFGGCDSDDSSPSSNTTCIAPEQTESGLSDIQIEEAFPNLTISSLVGLYQSPGDSSRWYAMSQSGKVYWFDNTPTATTLNDFVDLSSLVRHSGEQGLLGMAFDPQYASNGRVYF